LPTLADSLLLFSPLVYAAWLAVLALAAGGAFAAKLTHCAPAPHHGSPPNDELCLGLALTIGLGVLGQALFLIGAAGRFGAVSLAVVASVALIAWRNRPAPVRRELASFFAGTRRQQAGRGVLVAAALAGPVWLALYPPVSWDDTVYHLPLARSLAEQGRYLFVENLRAPVFPLLAETLFAPALLLGRASTTHGVSLLATTVTGLLLVVWGRERFAGAFGGAAASLWPLLPVALWIGQPIVILYAGSAYIDPLLTLFATAAALSFERWRRDRSPAWLLAAGAFAGWAAATKYLGLYLVAALAFAAGWEAGRGARLRAMAKFAGAALCTGGPWYALVWALSGNPLFPFLAPLFGQNDWSGITEVAGSGLSFDWRRGGRDLLSLGWDLVVDRARTNQQPPASPLVVVALPLLALAAWRRPWTRLWVATLAGYAVAFLALPRDARYFMFFSPLLMVLLVEALRELIERGVARGPAGPRRAAVAGSVLLLSSLAAGSAYAAWHSFRLGPLPVTVAAIDAHLGRRVPLYRALLFRRAHGLDQVPLYALHGERLHDFGGAALLGDWSGPQRYELVLPLLDRPDELAHKLLELGAGELLLPRALVPEAIVEGVAASPRFRELYRDDEGALFALTSAGAGSG
jgi:hypothetical protein